MAWARLDDKFWSHPKVRKAGTLAAGVYAQALSYASDHLTDGFIPDYMLAAIADVSKYDTQEHVVYELVEAGLFEPVIGGWVIHDFLEWNPSKEKVEEIRGKRAVAGKSGGQRSGESRRASSNVEARAKQLASDEANTKQLASGMLEAKPNPVPIPSRTHPVSHPHPIPAARAHVSSLLPAHGGEHTNGDARARDSWVDECWGFFVADYPGKKTFTTEMRALWPEHCRDPDSFDRIMAGLSAWKLSESWRDKGGRFISNPMVFLETRKYEDRPDDKTTYGKRSAVEETNKALETLARQRDDPFSLGGAPIDATFKIRRSVDG